MSSGDLGEKRARVCKWCVTVVKTRRPIFIVGAPRFTQRSEAEISATRHGSSRCEKISSLRRLVSRAGKTELAPTFKDAPPLTLPGLTEPSIRRMRVSTHSSDFSGIISRHNKIDKQVRHALQVSGNAPRLKMDEEFLGRRFVGKMKPTVQVLEAFRGLLLGLCRTGILTDVKISQRTRVAHSGGKLKSGLPGGPVR